MILNILIVALSLVLAGLFNSEMDTIEFRPHQAWFSKHPAIQKFWLRKLWKVNWFRKTFLFFTLDGWHLCKGVQIYSLLYPSAYLIVNDIALSFLIAIPLMMFLGAIFELSYNN